MRCIKIRKTKNEVLDKLIQFNRISTKDYLKFIVPSVIGILLFMIPFQYDGKTTITVALLSNLLTDLLSNKLPFIITIFISFTGIFSIIYRFFKPDFIDKNHLLKNIFNVSIFWLITRIIGMILAIMVCPKIGPEWVWSEDTGGLILLDLIPNLFCMFLFAGFLLPLLTDFGLLELIGALLTNFMRPVFTLPGRSSIDCIASWVGDGTIGVTLTNKQYEEGYYTTREASVIATAFSAVSITFCLVILSQVDLAHMFLPYYLSVTAAGVVAALILPRIPPLSNKPDKYIGGVKRDSTEDVPEGVTPFKWGMILAVNKASESGNIKDFICHGMQTVLDMWLGVMPVIMTFGTIALIIAEITPIFQWLGMPFIPILKLLHIPYAQEASQTMIVGFADMFLPSVIGARIPSELTRFVIAGVSVTQLLYLSEVGAVILGTKIPISLSEMFVIFLQRTLITLPVIALVAHIIF